MDQRLILQSASLAVLALAVAGFAGYKLVSGADLPQRTSAAASQHPSPPGGHSRLPSASTPVVQASTAKASPATTPSPPSPSPVPVQALVPASVAAFGPVGTADGDNPQLAALAVGGNPATPWSSQWYATPAFGDVKAGTGLLLDMGHTVTVASVRLSLVSRSGTDLQLRAGNTPTPTYMPLVASSSDTGGTVQLGLGAQVHVRYVLIWFTKLPPDAAGTYQVSVYKIIVQGQP